MLETAIRAAREAGAVLRRGYLPARVRVKGYRDIMTEVDLAAERVAVGIVREAFPDATIMSEESYTRWQHSGDEPAWFIDPRWDDEPCARPAHVLRFGGVALGACPSAAPSMTRSSISSSGPSAVSAPSWGQRGCASASAPR